MRRPSPPPFAHPRRVRCADRPVSGPRSRICERGTTPDGSADRPVSTLFSPVRGGEGQGEGSGAARGFTLVEMLVAVALVLLMMTLFAQVFQMAGGSVSTQRGLMENDQRARTAQTLLAGDLNKRTFRKVVPYCLNEQLGAAEADLAKRRGYLYFSENNPANDWDDVLALTVDARITLYNSDESDYYGRALPLWPIPFPPAYGGIAASNRPRAWLYNNKNQPETDDGRMDQNYTADSPAAEVVYFVRNGNLYRRVLLIRTPDPGTAPSDEYQPRDGSAGDGNRFFAATYDPTGGSSSAPYPSNFASGFNSSGAPLGAAIGFWHDFDFSAHPVQTPVYSMGSVSSFYYDGAWFNGLSSLDITSDVPNLLVSPYLVPDDKIAYPPNRYGFNTVNRSPVLAATPAPPTGGQPKEYGVDGGGNATFFGRLTLEEASHANCVYPQLLGNAPANLMAPTVVPVLDTTTDYAIVGPAYLRGGARQGEDLLLTNVHAFDVEVWDENIQGFVDIGDWNLPATGDFHPTKNLNARIYGDPNAPVDPNDPNGRLYHNILDTWYPFQAAGVSAATAQALDFDANGSIYNEDQPVMGVRNGALDSGEDADGNGRLTAENEAPYRPIKYLPVIPGGSYVPYERWVANTSPTAASRYGVGSRVFPTGGQQIGDPFYYVCVGTQDLNGDMTISHGTNEPSAANNNPWQRVAGLKTTDGELIWQAVYNLKPIRALKITLRYLDPSTSQMRTLTIIHSLVD